MLAGAEEGDPGTAPSGDEQPLASTASDTTTATRPRKRMREFAIPIIAARSRLFIPDTPASAADSYRQDSGDATTERAAHS